MQRSWMCTKWQDNLRECQNNQQPPPRRTISELCLVLRHSRVIASDNFVDISQRDLIVLDDLMWHSKEINVSRFTRSSPTSYFLHQLQPYWCTNDIDEEDNGLDKSDNELDDL